MNQEQRDTSLVGFWFRLSAILLDIAFVWVVTAVVRIPISLLGFYCPVEAIFIVAFMVYSVAFVAWRGNTIGKAIFGLRITSSHSRSLGFPRAILREVIGKALSGAILLLGFLFVAISKKRRAWHDYIAGTSVVRNPHSPKHSRLGVVIVLCLAAVLAAQHVVRRWIVFHDAAKVSIDAPVAAEYSTRNPEHLITLSGMLDPNWEEYSEWLLNNRVLPEDFIIQTAKKHQLTILGERHHIQENLLLLKSTIPRLYHEAGVTRIGLEVCVSEDNKALEKLVTSEQYDSDLALRIARHEGWKSWGDKEYWDILEAVWRLNRRLPDANEKMLVIGLDQGWDLPSMALAGIGDNAIDAPIWERLRLLRIACDMPLMLKRDEIMARNVQKEIFEKSKRGLVLIGGNHAFVKYRQPIVIGGQIIREWSRMGFLLHHRYGEEVFQITLHGALSAGISDFMEQIISAGGLGPLGFEVSGSPFENLRDDKAHPYQTGVCFGDLTLGYVFIRPRAGLTRCQWLDGYISQGMFLKDKPYYLAEYGWSLKSASEANRAAKQKYTDRDRDAPGDGPPPTTTRTGP